MHVDTISAALGSVIGYVGAEVARPEMFERVFWPQRFHNSTNILALIKTALLGPMGGPLHRAALQVLEKISEHGLHRGRQQGHMLGSVFYPWERTVKHRFVKSTDDLTDKEKDIRNGFWLRVLQHIETCHIRAVCPERSKSLDLESKPTKGKRIRTRHYVFLLQLDVGEPSSSTEKAVTISEDETRLRTWIGVILSESISVGIGAVIAVWSQQPWISILLFSPLLLKILATMFSLRRESLMHLDQTSGAKGQSKLQGHEGEPSGLNERRVLSEMRTQGHEAVENLGVVFVTTAHSDCFLQFCRHYGHPIRESGFDRLRELICILIAYAFVLVFPLGLLLVLLSDTRTQCLWLGYQLYTVLAMHVTRLTGWMGTGRTEEQVAKALEADGMAYLSGNDGSTFIRASLQLEGFENVTSVRSRTKQLLAEVPT